MDIIPRSEAPPLDSRLAEVRGDMRAERLAELVRAGLASFLVDDEGLGLGLGSGLEAWSSAS